MYCMQIINITWFTFKCTHLMSVVNDETIIGYLGANLRCRRCEIETDLDRLLELVFDSKETCKCLVNCLKTELENGLISILGITFLCHKASWYSRNNTMSKLEASTPKLCPSDQDTFSSHLWFDFMSRDPVQSNHFKHHIHNQHIVEQTYPTYRQILP